MSWKTGDELILYGLLENGRITLELPNGFLSEFKIADRQIESAVKDLLVGAKKAVLSN